ncbi:MAG TPA: hypothetical protein VKD22_14195 [Ramlibacter sp.]|nr:hypothetical protein [Ramlibacter sp.]
MALVPNFVSTNFTVPAEASAEEWAWRFRATLLPLLSDLMVGRSPTPPRTIAARAVLLQFLHKFQELTDVLLVGVRDAPEEAAAYLHEWNVHVTPLAVNLWRCYGKVYVRPTPEDGYTTLPLDILRALWQAALTARLLQNPAHGFDCATVLPERLNFGAVPLGVLPLSGARFALEALRTDWTRQYYDEDARAASEALLTHVSFVSRWSFPESCGMLDDESMRVQVPLKEPPERYFGVNGAFLNFCAYVFHDLERAWRWRAAFLAHFVGRGFTVETLDDTQRGPALRTQTGPSAFSVQLNAWFSEGCFGGRMPQLRKNARNFTWAVQPGDLGQYRERFSHWAVNAQNVIAKLRPDENRRLTDMISGSDDDEVGFLSVSTKDPADRFVQELRDEGVLYLLGQQLYMFVEHRFKDSHVTFDLMRPEMDAVQPWVKSGDRPLIVRCSGEVWAVLPAERRLARTHNLGRALDLWMRAMMAACPRDSERLRRLSFLHANLFERGVYEQEPEEREGVFVGDQGARIGHDMDLDIAEAPL